MLLVLTLALLHLASASEFVLPVRMPNLRSAPGVEELYLCTYVPIPESADPLYVVGFDPAASMTNAHHMLLYSCDAPGLMAKGDEQPVWSCGHDPTGGALYPDHPTCTGSTNALLYAWARNAKKIDLPEGVGFEVGGPTAKKYMVVQVHYMNMDQDNDSSGVMVRMTPKPQPNHAGVIIMGHLAGIPANSVTYLETSCRLPSGNVKIHPIGFRTHAHSLGAVISGYRVSPSKDDWALIGKMSPKRPQAFYPVADPNMVISGGDYLAARCTMVSVRNRTTNIGATNNDEMCNYYVMFYFEAGTEMFDPATLGCWSSVPRSWNDLFTNIPADASEFEGVNYKSTNRFNTV